ncbi:hypothetical protein HID58_028562 [Brassica napus]|uniref:Elongator complex protein 2 n=1 Tax=Brassica napus TaxID=3708 RepID=A0ABQ8CAL1_BRANA|nr:hypothetical protein HID58_028562 [Brassica napus]
MSGKTEASAKRVFIGAGCNRVVNNVSWGSSGLVSFGAQNAVAIFCPKTAQILTTLPGHKASVNCTHWLPSSKFAFKGHTDWIQSLDFSSPLHSTEETTSSIMLVSSSQDKVIRIWKLVLLGDVGSWQRVITLASYIEGPVFVSGTFTYQISVESVLIGHEDWVYSVEWQPPVTGHQPLSILSASMDKVNFWKRRSACPLLLHPASMNHKRVQAQSVAMAEIWLWEVGTCRSFAISHLEFSYDDSLLLSVSRDRHFSVFSIQRTAHKRIIWACSWNLTGHQFATSSRDKTVKIWSVEKDARIKQVLALPQFGSSVTAVAWTGSDHKDKSGCIAVGMESGLIELWNIKIKEIEDEGTTASAVLLLGWNRLCVMSQL